MLIIASIGIIISIAWALLAMIGSEKSDRAYNVLISLDRTANAALGGNPSDSISGRAYTASLAGKKWGICLCRFLDMLQKDHCENTHGK